MSNITPQLRGRIYKAISNGWSTDRIVNTYEVSPQSVAAFRANATMGHGSLPAPKAKKSTKRTARTSSSRSSTNRLQFVVPNSSLTVTRKGKNSQVVINLD